MHEERGELYLPLPNCRRRLSGPGSPRRSPLSAETTVNETGELVAATMRVGRNLHICTISQNTLADAQG